MLLCQCTAATRREAVSTWDEQTERSWSVAVAQGARCARVEAQPETERPADVSRQNGAKKSAGNATFDETMITARDQLPALIAKISDELANKPEYFVTHPAEMKVLDKISDDELHRIAHEHGWRFVRRLGRRQIQFYNDVSVRPIESGRNTSPPR